MSGTRQVQGHGHGVSGKGHLASGSKHGARRGARAVAWGMGRGKSTASGSLERQGVSDQQGC